MESKLKTLSLKPLHLGVRYGIIVRNKNHISGDDTMTKKEQKKAAKEFAQRWAGRGYEKDESNLFWIDLLTHVYSVDNIADFISFEDQVHLDHTPPIFKEV